MNTVSKNRRLNLQNRTRARGAVHARCTRRASAVTSCKRTELRRCTTKTASDWGYIDEPVMRAGVGGLRYFHRNQQYSVIALTDSNANVKERYAYTAYGSPTITDAAGATRTSSAEYNRYMYTGREWDETLDLYHYRARMYDAISGRFCSRDPIGYQFGNNLYQFVKAQVLRSSDPYGLFNVAIGGSIYKGLGGGASFTLADRAEPCCNSAGENDENGKKFIDLTITGEAGIGIGGSVKFKINNKFGFSLKPEVAPAKFVDELTLTLENETCGEFDFGCVSGSLTVSGQKNYEVSGSAALAGFGFTGSLALNGTVSMTVDVSYCPATGGNIKSTVCGGVTGVATLDLDHPFDIFDNPEPWTKTLDDVDGGNPLAGGCYELANIDF